MAILHCLQSRDGERIYYITPPSSFSKTLAEYHDAYVEFCAARNKHVGFHGFRQWLKTYSPLVELHVPEADHKPVHCFEFPDSEAPAKKDSQK